MSEQKYTRLGRDLRAARLKKGLSQQKLADLLGCQRQRIILWEKGTNRPRGNYRSQLADQLGRQFDWSADVALMSAEESGADMRTERRLEERVA